MLRDDDEEAAANEGSRRDLAIGMWSVWFVRASVWTGPISGRRVEDRGRRLPEA